MATDFRQIKANITVEADVWIDSIAEAKGLDRGEVVRNVLHEWALEQERVHRIASRRRKSEGLTGASEVPSGTDSKMRTASQD